MKKRRVLIVGCLIVIFIVVAGPWLAINSGILMLKEPPKPQITHGEFDFTLIYEISGERKIIKDTILCDYVGTAMDEANGKYREWKAELKSGRKEIILWQEKNDNGIKKEIYYNYALPGYYMGDSEYKNSDAFNYSDVVLQKVYKDSVEKAYLNEKKLYEEYQIKIVSWQCESPIVNSFS